MKKTHVLFAVALIGGSVVIAVIGNRAGLNKDSWPGWVQAIGSIVALLVAVFVMGKQNAHAAKLALDADKRALLRKVAAVSAVVDRTHEQMDHSFEKLIQVAEAGNAQLSKLTWSVERAVLQSMKMQLDSVPLHELGSYELVTGIHKTMETLNDFDVLVSQWINDPRTSPNLAGVRFSMPNMLVKANSAKAIYQQGLAALKAS